MKRAAPEAGAAAVIYWSGSGSTERIARAVAEAAGCDAIHVCDASPSDIEGARAVALGSPALGDEGIEETEMAPFIEASLSAFAGKTVFLFGSCGWGGEEWLNKWAERLTERGVSVARERLAVRESSEGGDASRCAEFGRVLLAAAGGG